MMGVFVQINAGSRWGAQCPIGYIICENGCWEWVGVIGRGGYGQVKSGGKTLRAHRHVYEQIMGAIPAGLTLDHLCRNRQCVNPSHLEPVTGRTNCLRGISPIAKFAAQTHCKRGHSLSEPNLMPNPLKRGVRSCKQCFRMRQRHYKTAARLRVAALIPSTPI